MDYISFIKSVFSSEAFDEFLTILGDKVRLKGFDKYKGGLDTVHDLTGLYSVYTHWRSIEVMFHVSTLLPYEKNDPQKLQRKRHVGNDIVCVVFLEADNTRFSPSCIKSHFLHTFIVSDRPPRSASVRLWNLTGLSVILKIRHKVLKHLRPRSLLHPRKLWGRVAASFTVDNLGKNPVAKHRTLREDGLFPQIGFVSSHFVSGDDACFVSGRTELDLWAASDDNEGVEEVRFDATWGEPSVVRLKEDHADDVITNMAFPLQLLRVVLLVREQGGDVEHHLDAAPVGVD